MYCTTTGRGEENRRFYPMAHARLQMAHGRKLVIALFHLWLILLFLLPFP